MDNKEELIESQMEKVFCIWMYKDASGDVSGDLLVTRELSEKTMQKNWRLTRYKRIIREKDAKEFS